MSLNAALRLMAGVVILLSLALGTYVETTWYYLSGFVGLNLFQSGFTQWCPAVFIFQKMGLKAESCAVEGMSVNQGVHIIAGCIVLATLIPVLFFNAPSAILFVTAVIGISLVQSTITGWCPAMTIAKLFGFNPVNTK